MYLNDNEILNILVDYVKDDGYKQAVFLDGVWGCGKTFFIKEKFVKKITEELPYVYIGYVSLYGIQNIAQILDEIYAAIVCNLLEKKTGKQKGEVFNKGITIGGKFLMAGMKYFNIEKKDLPQISDFTNLNNAVLIFDDLERCQLDINEVLGAINDLVEHNNVKVILVANESELRKGNLSKDLVSKYKFALDDRLKLKNGDKILTIENGQKYTKKDLDERVQILFSEDLYYDKIKEKLIGINITYRVDFNEIYTNIIEKHIKDSQIKQYLHDNAGHIISTFYKAEHYNVRTLIFALRSFENIITKMIDIISIEDDSELIILILKYILNTSIQIKSGNKCCDWNLYESRYGYIYFGDINQENKIFGFRFVDEYLVHRYLKIEEIQHDIEGVKEVKKREAEEKVEKNKQSIIEIDEISIYSEQIDDWWKMEDNEVEELISGIYEELKKNIYPMRKYSEAILTLIQMKERGFENICYDEYIEVMSNNLLITTEALKTQDFECLSNNLEYIKIYNKIMEPLFNIVQDKEQQQRNKRYEFICDLQFWNEQFKDRCVNCRQNFYDEKKFFSYINIEKFIENINKAKTMDIYNFIDGMKKIYDYRRNINEYFKRDVIPLSLIEIKIKDIDCSKMGINKDKAIKKLETYIHQVLIRLN